MFFLNAKENEHLIMSGLQNQKDNKTQNWLVVRIMNCKVYKMMAEAKKFNYLIFYTRLIFYTQYTHSFFFSLSFFFKFCQFLSYSLELENKCMYFTVFVRGNLLIP